MKEFRNFVEALMDLAAKNRNIIATRLDGPDGTCTFAKRFLTDFQHWHRRANSVGLPPDWPRARFHLLSLSAPSGPGL